jgi:DNA-binding response OmpR family regulator
MAPRILIVEDDPLIALDLADQLSQASFIVVGPATSVSRATSLLSSVGCDAAVLDVNLGSETSEPLAHDLAARAIPFLCVSGYSTDQLPAVFQQAPLLSKPVHMPLLIDRLHKLFAA